MLAVISFALFAVVAATPESALKPQEVPAPATAHKPLLTEHQRLYQVPPAFKAVYPYLHQQYQVPVTYQTPYYQQAAHQYSGVYYQPQQYNSVHYVAPQPSKFVISKTSGVSTTPQVINSAAHAAPATLAADNKPVLREFNHPQLHPEQPQFAILRQSLDNNFDGHFQYDFETENGISMVSSGSVKQLSPEQQAQVIQGSYSYTTPEGLVITTTYVADENGFVASGDHLPQAPVEPELPPLIAKSLAYIRSLPPQPENQQ